jgi:hypothetical protein
MFDYAIALERALRYSFAAAFDELIDFAESSVCFENERFEIPFLFTATGLIIP